MNKKKHQGKIIEKAVRNSGYTLVYVAEQLQVSRNTLYTRFKEMEVDHMFLFDLKQVINYDFTKDIPELLYSPTYQKALRSSKLPAQDKIHQELSDIQKNYYKVLEDYNKLLKFLVHLINDNELHSLKKELSYFMKNGFDKE